MIDLPPQSFIILAAEQASAGKSRREGECGVASTCKISFLSLAKCFSIGRLSAISVCLVFALTTCDCVLAQTNPVSGIQGFETGLRKLYSQLSLDHVAHLGDANPLGAQIQWGDDTPTEPGLLKCEGQTNNDPCDVYGTHSYCQPGTYTIKITYDDPPKVPFGSGSRHSVTTTATISAIGDFVILSIGDSVASGEGDPVVAYKRLSSMSPNHAFWDDPGSDYDLPGGTPEQEEARRDCDRSLIAGPAQAGSMIAKTNPITFVHFACSGATVYVRNAAKNSSTAVSQLRIARHHLPRIDVLLISAGANDIRFTKPDGTQGEGFGDVLERCLKPADNCSDDPNFKDDVNSSIAGIQADYVKLDQEIHCINPDNGTQEEYCTDPDHQIPKLVLITEYMDETHIKRVDDPSTEGFPTATCVDAGIRQNEWEFLYNNVVKGLNDQVHEVNKVTPEHPSPLTWYPVTGIQDDFMAHGYCAGSQRWIVTGPDSEAALNGTQGTGHPNAAGQQDYRDRIYQAIVAENPPVTTASATTGGSPYPFGTWAGEDVEITLSASNGIKESGVNQTYYAVDNPNCNFADLSASPNGPQNCLLYSGPFTISNSGKHTVTFFSVNAHGTPEALQSVPVWVDKNPPLSSTPTTMTILHGASASYTITVGHQGWDGQTINLSCTTDADLAQCTTLPASVTLDETNATNTSVATVVTTLGGGLLQPKAPAQPKSPFGPLVAMRALLGLAAAGFLFAVVDTVRRRRWAPAAGFTGVALLFGLLCAGCNTALGTPGTPPGAYTVTITGISGTSTNTVQVKLIVQ